MHLRARLTKQPKGGPFDQPVADHGYAPQTPAHPGVRTYSTKAGTPADTGLGAGAVGRGQLQPSRAAPSVPMPTAAGGGGSTAISQPTHPVYCAGGKTMGDSRAYVGAQTQAIRSHVPRRMGVFDFPQEGGSRRNDRGDQSVQGLNRRLNQVAPGSQTRNQ